MAISGVNGSTTNNTGLYTASATVAGGLAGATYGYFSKPFFKNGEPTDKFIKQLMDDTVKSFPDVERVEYEKELKILEDIDNIKNVDDLQAVMKNILEIDAMDPSVKKIFDNLDDTGINIVKPTLKRLFGEDIFELQNDISEAVKDSWNNKSKKFIFDENILDEKEFKLITSVAKKMQHKAAGLYGAIGAGVLGLGTYLFCASKKAPNVVPEQKVDTKA